MLTNDWNRCTRVIRITRMALFAGAYGDMIDNPAFRIGTAGGSARIYATVLNAVLIACTFRIQNALRTTSTVRITDVIGWAEAISFSILVATLCVDTTR